MKDFQILLAAVTSIILFIFGLENFSLEVQKITGEKFRRFVGKVTTNRFAGVALGAVVTAIVQSSSATSVLTIGLVNAGVLSFKNSIAVIFGANIGSTITAQLVAFKLTSFAPVFIILGTLLTFIRSKYSVFAKSIFYFGFVFFSLNLISATMAPLQNDERITSFLLSPQSPVIGVFIGALITAIVQSSSVTTGLAIIFTQQGMMGLDNAIAIVMGANIGTTATAMLSIINMDLAAKKTAIAHFFFNIGGVVIFLPVFIWGHDFLPLSPDNTAIALANFHLIFNVVTTFLFIVFLKPFTNFIEKLLGEGKMDFEHFDFSELLKASDFEQIERELLGSLGRTLDFAQENYNLITLSIETNYKKVYEAFEKRMAYMDYIKEQYFDYFSHFMASEPEEKELHRFIEIMRLYEYIFQINDSIRDLATIKDSIDDNYIELKSDLLLIVRDLAAHGLKFFEMMKSKGEDDLIKKEIGEYQGDLDQFNRKILKLMNSPERKDAGTIYHLITYSQRLKDKLVTYHKLSQKILN